MEVKDGLLLLYSTEEIKPWYEDFFYGVEEEGVPIYCVNSSDEALTDRDALCLAKLSAHYCCFDLGIGADEDELVIRHRLQSDDAPLFSVSRNTAKSAGIRRAGHNAARIIKSVPLILDE